jgi:hypothetical protein
VLGVVRQWVMATVADNVTCSNQLTAGTSMFCSAVHALQWLSKVHVCVRSECSGGLLSELSGQAFRLGTNPYTVRIIKSSALFYSSYVEQTTAQPHPALQCRHVPLVALALFMSRHHATSTTSRGATSWAHRPHTLHALRGALNRCRSLLFEWFPHVQQNCRGW